MMETLETRKKLTSTSKSRKAEKGWISGAKARELAV